MTRSTLQTLTVAASAGLCLGAPLALSGYARRAASSLILSGRNSRSHDT